MIASTTSALSAQVPHVTGKVQVNPDLGLLEADLCTSSLTPTRSVRFLLNTALNIKNVTVGDGLVVPYQGETSGRVIGEGREYVVQRPDTAQAFSSFCVAYRGAVPVYESNTATSDWKGRIAAGFGTLRAAEQTRWYPTLFDSASTRMTTTVTYALEVRCPTCRAIYVNGAEPIRDTVGTFASNFPRDLLLYAGDFSFGGDDRVAFLGGAADAKTTSVFSESVAQIAAYYASLMKEPYRDRPVLLSFTSVSRDRRRGQVSWQFVTWPTITFAGGVDFDQMLDRTASTVRFPSWLWPSMSHEMGHYYFGTRYFPHGPLFWFALESTAEYLALLALQHLQGELPFQARLVSHTTALATTFPLLSDVRTPADIGDAHRYRFAPLQLVLLERRVGRERVLALLRGLLHAPAQEAAEWPLVQRLATEAGISDADLNAAFGASNVEVRNTIREQAQTTLAGAIPKQASAAVQLASTLVNADTATASRLRVRAALKQLVRRVPNELQAHYEIGRIGALTGSDLPWAESSLRKYLAHPAKPGAPTHTDATWWLALVAEKRGDTATARALFHEVLKAFPTHQGALAGLRRVGG